jgi:uncharacterized membrane protein
VKSHNIEEWLSKNIIKILMSLIGLAAIGGAISIILYRTYFDGAIEADNVKWGTFGDYFGGTLNPILSFLALIAVLLTIALQRKEMSDSSQASQIDSFERNFFELLRHHMFIVDDLSMEKSVIEETTSFNPFDGGAATTKLFNQKGRACFKHLRDELERIYYEETLGKSIKPDEYPLYIKQAYSKFAEEYEHKIGHYFRFLYRVFKHINESNLENKKKKHYSGITRALLSSNELALLFYDCFYSKGAKFSKLIIKFRLFENMEFEKLLDRKNHMPLFHKDAYGEDGLPSDINPQVSVYFNK